MPPKGKNKSAFYFYMIEVQEKEAARGVRIPKKSLSDYCNAGWQKLSLVEREPYEEQARKHKNNPNLRGGKLASDGTRVEDNLMEIEEKKRLEIEMIHSIKTFVSINDLDKEQFKEFASKKLFYFISFNILCETENEIIPIEVGLVEYSIQYGIHRDFHTIIHPGVIPTGFTGEAKRLSEEKHEIDIFGKDAPSDSKAPFMYKKILNFISPEDESENYPPLFTLEDDLRKTSGCLEFLRSRYRSPVRLKVWNSKYLLMELRDGCGQALPSHFIASDLLTKSSFNYYPQSRCIFHDDKDCYHCALAYSKRLCYLISDAVCEYFDVEPTENHMPGRTTEEKGYVVSMASDFSSRSSVRNLEPNGINISQPSSYYQNEYQCSDRDSSETYSRPSTRMETPDAPRQPSSHCLAAEMSRLRLKTGAASVHGHGIGRGQRRN